VKKAAVLRIFTDTHLLSREITFRFPKQKEEASEAGAEACVVCFDD
jgi:hypothetical protein